MLSILFKTWTCCENDYCFMHKEIRVLLLQKFWSEEKIYVYMYPDEVDTGIEIVAIT